MKYILFVLIAFSSFGFSQDETLSIVSYNLLNFPDGRDDCGNNTVVPNRADTLKKITDYLQPDIFVACEVQTQSGVNAVLNDALNANGNSNFAVANFNGSGYLHNVLFYNTNKLTLKSQYVITTSPRDIDHYVLYLNDPNLDVYYDTTFIEVYMMHLKAGSSNSSETQREGQTQVLMDYIANRPTDRNVFVAGDMNVYNSNDDGYQNMTTGGFALQDPINSPGNWHNNGSFSAIHTQSTRTSANYDCGSKGGLDDRFDQILVSQNVMNNTDNLEYQTGSYRAVGNDGSYFNSNLLSGTNSMYPIDVVRALYYMSDHLPVELKVEVNYPTSNGLALVPSKENVSCYAGSDGTATITPNLGQAPYTYQWDANANNQMNQTATQLSAGTYCVTVTDDLGETDDYCVVIGEPDPIQYNAFITPDNAGDCSGRIELLVGGGTAPYTYSWSDFPGNNSNVAEDLCSGNYEILVTDSNACEELIEKFVEGTTGVSKIENSTQNIHLYPNPTQDRLTVKATHAIQTIKILTLSGQVLEIEQNKLKNNLYELDTRQLTAGVYFVKLKIKEIWINSRIVVK